MAYLRCPWNITASGHCLDVASLDTKNQLGCLDCAAFGESMGSAGRGDVTTHENEHPYAGVHCSPELSAAR